MIYFCVDCEASGPVPPLYNLLSVGVTVVRPAGDHHEIGDSLYLGRDGLTQIVRVRKSDGGFIGSFASPGGVCHSPQSEESLSLRVIALAIEYLIPYLV